jgi:hypothetical protein
VNIDHLRHEVGSIIHRRCNLGGSVVVQMALVPISCGVVLWAHNQTTTFLGSTVDGLDDVNQLLFVFQEPVEFVVVTRAKITHHVLIAEEEL